MFPILPGGDPDKSKDFNSLTSDEKKRYINLSHVSISTGLGKLIPDIHLEEAKSFIREGEFPLSPFIKNKISKMQEMGRARDAVGGKSGIAGGYGAFKMPKWYWNRLSMGEFRLQNSTDPSDKKAYSIFMGTTLQPCFSSSSASSSSTSGSLTGSNYQQLVSICKSILPK